MRERIAGWVILGVLLAGAGHAETPSTYQALVDQLKASATDPKGAMKPVDYRGVRYAYADSPTYDPYGTLVELSRVEMLQAYQHKDDEVALDQANRVLDQNYADIGAHVIAALAYSDLKNKDMAAFHRRLAREFLLTIFRSGDGKSPATAYQIVSVPEEYAVLNAEQLEFEKQSYVTVSGGHYDKIIAHDGIHGGTVTLYFNVDRLMAWANGMFSPQFQHLKPHGGPPAGEMAAR